MNQVQKKPKKRFVLTMRNEKGQVGIFVALIFQVIFVFFAMLVNVGLVVHHKINLQQSTDLAAYYGAMKQAEIMNVMAHVNFQIRQAWKLMSWRYRVLGTFGLEHNNRAPGGVPPIPIKFPLYRPDTAGLLPRYNSDSRGFACSGSGPKSDGVTITDVPFMCLGHIGFSDWISAPNDKETFCKVECNAIEQMKAFSITQIPGVGTASIYGNSMGAAVNAAIGRANAIVNKTCTSLGPITTQMLALYYGNYIKDTQNRRNFIYMLTKNLGLPEEQMLDVEGKSILTGVQNTLKNNLTEANLTSMTGNSISALNGVKSFGGSGSFAESMMKEINFQRLLFFMIDCALISGEFSIELKSLYQGAAGDIDTRILTQLNGIMDPAGVAGIQNLFNQNSDASNILGYEKNPWIQVYYGVKATSEPKIPFLPLAKIKLSAVSFAKPFGGTIGPWYFKTWDSGTDDNKGRADWENRTDFNLPRRNLSGLTATPSLKDAREFIFNYSTHVGDTYSNDAPNRDRDNKGGLANNKIVGFYHTLLANKYGRQDSPSSSLKTREPQEGQFAKPSEWPRYSEWYHLGADITDPTYDPLAVNRANPSAPKNTYMRDIELSVVSPNQFDVTYYSIEPDFLSNYSSKLTVPVIQNMASKTGLPTPPVFPVDFGNRRATDFQGVPARFSVRHQMQVTHDLFKNAANDIVSLFGSGDSAIKFGLDVLASKPSSLLTGWTFLNLSSIGYGSFPAPNSGGGNYSMLFGTCDGDTALNPWADNFQAPYEIDGTLPAAQGNCVTGGRTGYSVKLISSELLRPGKIFNNLGGEGTTGQIKNPVPEDFLQF